MDNDKGIKKGQCWLMKENSVVLVKNKSDKTEYWTVKRVCPGGEIVERMDAFLQDFKYRISKTEAKKIAMANIENKINRFFSL